MKKYLGKINFNKANVGTVHTFQGKEAAVVYLVLGASTEETGAASWAVSEPNLMNVAATRAKKEFYIIGDKKLYQSIGAEVVDKTLEVFEGE
ncbi:AAA domain-containing protein [Bombilactobacillus folatiphilus]|uniref:AAA domain-containing protein n=1 Tax=Bombilactobacillus folatiphilus TaxID=2923362 RepID=A0ABY4P895_9LACO|nr:AAA domain-containing protein [Bombilactobacillus folatiphilus]UQS81821.1 AAA domain-containing protein [Bombilactobacillus folatiphilus]